MSRTLLKELHAELLVAHRSSHLQRWAHDAERQKARLAYEKIQLVKARKPFDHIDRDMKALGGEPQIPELPELAALQLVDSHDPANLHLVVSHLRSQREYNELLHRFNPGLSMLQEDNVRKTANYVGLAVPQ